VNCLHFGCGLNAPAGWENIDASSSLRIAKLPLIGEACGKTFNFPAWQTNNTKYGDVVRGLSCPKEQYELVFSAHVLEHLSLEDFHSAISNVSLYLKPNGIFRTIVPDLDQYIQEYVSLRSDEKTKETASIQFLERSLLGRKSTRATALSRIKQGLSNGNHQWMWNKDSLVSAISSHRFSDVRLCMYGDWSDQRFSQVERKDDYYFAIGIEARK